MNVPIVVLGDLSGKYIEAIESTRGSVSVSRHVHELSELLGIAQTGVARAALLVSGYEDFTTSLLANLSEHGIGVVAILEPDESKSFQDITYVSALAEPKEVIEALELAAEEAETVQLTFKSANTHIESLDTNVATVQFEAQKTAKIIAVWGPAGAVGRSTIALNCAALLASRQFSVCLIDADTYQPSQSSLLGMLDDYSSLSQLCHLADRGQLEQKDLSEIVSTVKIGKGNLDVVTGITRADRWPEIRSQALESVLNVLSQSYDYLFIDTGFSIEADEELSFDGVAPRRNAATLTSLEVADEIVLIGSADTLGIPRLMNAVSELLSSPNIQVDANAVHVWINKVRTSSIGANPQVQLLQSWERFGPKLEVEGFIPFDLATVDKSWLTGRTWVESAPKTEIAQALTRMLDQNKWGEDTVKPASHQEPEQPGETDSIESPQGSKWSPRFFKKNAKKKRKEEEGT